MNRKILLPIISLIFLGLASQAYGGLYLYELGTEDLGHAGFGSAVRAEDA